MLYKSLLHKLRHFNQFSEEELARAAHISRMTLRRMELGVGNPTLASFEAVASKLQRQLLILVVPEEKPKSDYSTVAVSFKILHEGFDSWKIHFMELVDEFRKTLDPRLLLLPPVGELDTRGVALLASIVLQLCAEVGLDPPDWATQSYFLETPWFISEMESLKATALLESPVYYRKNNIFVLENFLTRV